MPFTPLAWRDEQTVNTPTAGFKIGPEIVQLANGNILVSWTTLDRAAPEDGAGASILAQLYDPLGNRIGGEFRLNNVSTEDDEHNTNLAALPGGGFVVAYHDSDLIGGGGSNILLEEFDSTGAEVTENANVVIDAGAPNDPNYRGPRVAASRDTSVLIVYDVYSQNSANVFSIRGKIYDPITDTYSAQISLIELAEGSSNADVTALPNGNYVIAGSSFSPASYSADSYIAYRIINSAGGNVREATRVAGTTTNAERDDNPTVTALAGGGFVIAWTRGDVISSIPSHRSDVLFRVYDAAGTELAAGAVGSGSAINFNTSPVVTALADGSFVVAFRNGELDRVDVEHFSTAGVSLGLPFALAGPGSQISAASLGDGRFATTWFDVTTRDINLEILDTRDAPNDPGVYAPERWAVGTVGDDVFAAAPDAEITHGWDGDDTITESGGSHRYYGDAGDDKVVVVSAIDGGLHDGGAGTDTIDWSASAEVGATYNLFAGTATAAGGGAVEQMRNFENFIGSAGRDIVVGTGGMNDLRGNGGNDTLSGGAGDDTLFGGLGNDGLYGGTGRDTASYLGLDAVTVSLAIVADQNTGGGGTDILNGIENVTGTSGNDTLTGDNTRNVLSGGLKDDVLDGAGGDDTLIGGAGNDILTGGAGNDTADFSAAPGPITVNFTLSGPRNTGEGFDTFSSIENLIGSAFGDRFTGQFFDNRFDGAGGADQLRGGSGKDRLNGDSGADLIVGDFGEDIIDGGADVDRLYGGTSNDTIFGGASGDTLIGGPNADRLDGGDGIDRLYADAASADTFVFNSLAGAGDRVFGFTTGLHELEIDISVFGGTTGAFALVTAPNPAPTAAQQTFLYYSTSGLLYFDRDGAGAAAATLLLSLYGAPTLAAGDILLV